MPPKVLISLRLVLPWP